MKTNRSLSPLHHMWRAKVIYFFIVLGFALPFNAAERPDIIVIMVDDMGYSDLGCYGGEIKTPNLDKLAANGLRYTQMYNTSKCWTTRISLLTGLWHTRSGRDFEHSALAGEILRPAGYHTWWVGKHHAGFNPYERGFDHFSGFLGGAINFWNPGGKNSREGEPVPGWAADYSWAFDEKVVKPYVPDKDFYATDRFTDWALEWMDESKESAKPFFLYVAYNAPHWPLHAHPEDIAKYDGVYDKGYAAIREARYSRQIGMGLFDAKTTQLSDPDFGRKEWDALSQDKRQKEVMRMQTHAAMVDRVDQNVGRLVTKLKEQQKFDNTIIFFLVDNGASAEGAGRKISEPWGSVGTFESIGQQWALTANTPLRFWKATSHEGGIATPMVVHWPKGIQGKGEFSREPCHLVDLLPTWMELAGPQAEYPGLSKQSDIPDIDGVSIVPTFSGQSLTREQAFGFQFGSGKAIRDGEWKLVRRNKGNEGWELYHIASDRSEINNLAARHPERAAAMEREWQQWYLDTTGNPFKEPVKKKKQ